MAVKILQLIQNSPEWYEARKGKVTGSNADLLLTKSLDTAIQANFNSFKGNFYTQRGHILEPEAIEIYEQIHHTIVDRVGMVVNDKYPTASCSPDGIDNPFLIEVKCFGKERHNSIVKLSDIPYKIMAQLQFNMMVCELPLARLVLYNPDIENPIDAYREIEVKAISQIQQNMRDKLQ